jgi:hypothetical protein
MHWLVVVTVLAVNPAPLDPALLSPGELGHAEPGEGGQGRGPSEGGAADMAAAQLAPATPRKPAPLTPEEKKKLEEEIAKELGAPSGRAPTPSMPGFAPAVPPPSAPSGTSGTSQGQAGGSPFARILLLPDISAIGSGALAWNSLDVETASPRSDPFAPAHKFQPIFQELELGVQAVVDPYARADIFLSFSPDGAGVEEAYLTTLGLPLGFQLRAGQLYAPFGRQNQQHAHTWDFVDRPLALARLLAVDGLGGPGVDVSWLAPIPWFAELHLAYQSLAPAFDPESHNGGLARLVQFFDVSDASTLGVGVSAARIDAAGVDASRDVLGADVLVKIRPPSGRSYLALQGEVLLRRLSGFETAGGAGGVPEPPGTEWGGYAQAVYRDGAYLAYGARYERAPAATGGPEHRVSALATWLPSEFERIRMQLSYDRLPGGSNGFEALLQLEFSIGAHGAHPF